MKICGIDNSLSSAGITIFELNNNFEIIQKKYYAVKCEKWKKSDDKKLYSEEIKDGVIYLKPFNNDCDRIIRRNNFISKIVNDCEYVAIEGYSFASCSSSITKIAENTGFLKMKLYEQNNKIRIYEPTTIKKHFCGNGGANKEIMIENYLELGNPLNIDLSKKEFDKTYSNNCLNDIVDSYAICDFLLTELKLRYGFINIKELNLSKIECYNKIRKDSNENLLATNFIFNGVQ